MAQTYEINLIKLVEKFNSEEKCRAHLEALRWPEGVHCPRCNCGQIARIHDRSQFDCQSCRYQFSVTSGTIFHDTKLPLWKWFLAVYMIVEAKKGVSACQLQRTLGVAYRTAWYLCHRIRHAMMTPEGLLAGIVEIDETTHGGKMERKHGKAMTNKAWIVGAVERGGHVRLKATGDRKRHTLRQFIQENVSERAERVITDQYPGYASLGPKHLDVPRAMLNHSAGEYAKGNDHTNTIEGAWSLFKRSVVGSFHKISVKHLDAYLDEFEFKFNNRDNPFIFRDALVLLLRSENLEYQDLVA